MHPEISEPCADSCLGLGDLVGVMDGDMVFAAAMNVEIIAEILLRHRRALDMPAGKAHAPGARPLHLAPLASRGKFPQRKIGRMSLLSHLDALACFEARLVQPR